MGTMSLKHTGTWLVACLAALLSAAPAFALDPAGDMQLFAPAETDAFGGGTRAKEGLFASYSYLNWSISAPKRTEIGVPGATQASVFLPAANPNDTDIVTGITLVDAQGNPVAVLGEVVQVPQSNSLNTGFLGADFTPGNWFEIGAISEHQGWLFSTFNLQTQVQDHFQDNVHMVWNAPPFGSPPTDLLTGYLIIAQNGDVSTLYSSDFLYSGLPGYRLPIIFTEMKIENRASTWGTEFNYIYRMHPTDHHGTFEWMFGARYMEFNERSSVWGWGGPLDDSYWTTSADNHIVGPQLGLHWFRTMDRFTWDVQGRFTAGFNRQNMHQQGTLGSNLALNRATLPIPDTGFNGGGYPVSMLPTAFYNTAYENEFSPLVELGMKIKYDVTRSFSVGAGWNGMWVDNIARPVDMVNYQIGPFAGQKMGIQTQNNRQDMFVHGLTIDFSFNR
jgi:hypothetical protein